MGRTRLTRKISPAALQHQLLDAISFWHQRSEREYWCCSGAVGGLET
jgi:hypothetical protein